MRQLYYANRVTRETARRMAAVYDRYAMTVPPASGAVTQTRDRAAAKGWPPPLAWDDEDLDNPTALPKGLLNRADYCKAGRHLKTDSNAYYPPGRPGQRHCSDCRAERKVRIRTGSRS